MRTLLTFLAVAISVSNLAAQDEPVFSGPQVGETLAPFTVKGTGNSAGKDLNFVEQAAGKPTLLIFVHQVTRPSIGFTRAVAEYAATRASDGLHGGVVFLTDDVTSTEAWLGRARQALPQKTPLGISMDGQEGPGSYGLNRNVAVTVLVGNENKVTANFALVQPSLQSDAPKVLDEIVKLVGGKAPSIAELQPQMRRPATRPTTRPTRPAQRGGLSPELEPLVRQLINKEATPEQVAATAAKIEEHIKDNEADRKQLGVVCGRVVNGPRFANYGTEKSREYLSKWAKEFGGTDKDGSGSERIRRSR